MKTNKKSILWILAILTPVLLLICLAAGASGLGIPDWKTDTGRAILFLRLDRIITGFVVGAALSVAGVVLQALLRNPLAEPYVLGVSSGAALGASIAIVAGISFLGVFTIPLTAFLFAIATLATVYFLAGAGQKLSIYGIILSGVIVSSICSSILLFIIAWVPIEGLHSIMWWMLGDLQITSRPLLAAGSIVTILCIAGVWMLARELNALSLGSDMAHHVGVPTKLAVTLGLTLATLITSAAVSLAGLIGFAGLVIPHVTRSITGPDHKRLIPAAAIFGGLFLTICDAAARTILAPREIPVGVITAIIGGPFFLFILKKRRKKGFME